MRQSESDRIVDRPRDERREVVNGGPKLRGSIARIEGLDPLPGPHRVVPERPQFHQRSGAKPRRAPVFFNYYYFFVGEVVFRYKVVFRERSRATYAAEVAGSRASGLP